MSIYSTIPHGDLFVNNKYTRWYFAIIDNALSKNRTKSKEEYFEAHHILPKSIYPKYKSLSKFKWNSVLLTPKEHFVVHLLLTKSFISFLHKIKMNQSFFILSDKRNGYKHSRLYSSLRKDYVISDETRLKLSIAGKNRTQKEETKKKLSLARKGKPLSENHKQKLREAWKNRKSVSQETRDKISKIHKGRKQPLVDCPHCGKTGGQSNMIRWHYDNCKLSGNQSSFVGVNDGF